MDVLYEDKYSVLIVLQEYSLMAIWQGSPLLVTTGIVCYIVFADIHDINNAYSRNVSSWFPLLSAQRLLLIMMRVRSPAQVPGPGLEREMGSNERRESRDWASSGNIRSAETEPLAACSLNSALQVLSFPCRYSVCSVLLTCGRTKAA